MSLCAWHWWAVFAYDSDTAAEAWPLARHTLLHAQTDLFRSLLCQKMEDIISIHQVEA